MTGRGQELITAHSFYYEGGLMSMEQFEIVEIAMIAIGLIFYSLSNGLKFINIKAGVQIHGDN